MKRFVLAGLLATALSASADAQTTKGDLTVGHAWARATPSATGNGVVYLSVTDDGAPDTLTGASTPVADKAEPHDSKMSNGVMQMRAVDNLPISKDHPIEMAPGGYHLMLMGLKKQLKEGDRFRLDLTFAHTGTITTMVTVASAAAMDAPGVKSTEMGGMGH